MQMLMPLLGFFSSFFKAGLKLAGVRYAVELHEEATRLQSHAFKVTLESLEAADELPHNGGDHKEKALALFKEGILQQAQTFQALLNEPLPLDQASESLRRPFFDANASTNSFPPQGSDTALPAPVKNKGGRPRGSRNKPKPPSPTAPEAEPAWFKDRNGQAEAEKTQP
jgi:hypothetical protein